RTGPGPGVRGVELGDDDGRRAEEQDAGPGPGLRRAQLRRPELPRLPGPAAQAGPGRRDLRSRHHGQAGRATGSEARPVQDAEVVRLAWSLATRPQFLVSAAISSRMC